VFKGSTAGSEKCHRVLRPTEPARTPAHMHPRTLFDRRAWPPLTSLDNMSMAHRRLTPAALCLVALAPSCSHEPGVDPATATEVEGDLVVHVIDFGERSQKVYGLRLDDGGRRALALAEPPAVPAGTRVRVRGADDGSTIHVAALVPAPDRGAQPGAVARALVAGTKKRDRSWAFVLLDTGGGVNLGKAEAEAILFGQGRSSIRGYYEEVSYGLQAIRGEVFGPIRVQVQGSLCDVGNAAAQIVSQAGTMIERQFDQYLWYIGRAIPGCPWNGAAEQGRAARPTLHSFYNASTRCSTLAQEPGHNFGMQHSSALLCRDGDRPVALPTSMTSQCAHIEYGNPFDPMGSGCGHMNGLQKAYQEWLEGCNVVKVTRSGTFTLFPLEEPCNGVQLLQVPTPARQFRYSGNQSGVINSFFLELRVPVGFDATAIGQGDLGDGQPIPMGVYVVMGADVRDTVQSGNPNWLLDMTPGSRGQTPNRLDLNDGALPVGKPFQDPTSGGPTITVVSVDRTKAVVRVELAGGGAAQGDGEGQCLDGQAFRAPGPPTCASPPIAGPAADAGTNGSGDAGSVSPPAPDAGSAPPADAAGTGGTGGATGTTGATGGAGGGGPGAGGAGGRGGSAPVASPAVPAEAGGCSCRMTPAAPTAAPAAIVVALAVVFIAGRRRQRRMNRETQRRGGRRKT
jgi:MYXO-CTERM domain-containing protein